MQKQTEKKPVLLCRHPVMRLPFVGKTTERIVVYQGDATPWKDGRGQQTLIVGSIALKPEDVRLAPENFVAAMQKRRTQIAQLEKEIQTLADKAFANAKPYQKEA